jgi:hypothetical protein
MILTLFRSAKDTDIFGFTSDPAGCNLPDELGPWCKAGNSAQIYAGTSLDGLASSDPVRKAVERDGFYLARSGIFAVSATPEPGSIH